MNITQIRYFLAVVERMSFTKAAAEFGMVQSTVSKQIALLEEELGVQLFHRKGRVITLAPAGRILYDKFAVIARETDDVIRISQGLTATPGGKLNVGMLPFVDLHRIAPGLVRNFSAEFPNAELRFELRDRHDLHRLFIDGVLDCTFLLPNEFEFFNCEPDIKGIDLPRIPHRIIYPRAMFPEDYTPQISDFSDCTFYFARSQNDQERVKKIPLYILYDIGFVPKNTVWLETFDMAMIYVEEGMGVGVVGPSTRISENRWIRSIDIPGERSLMSMTLYWRETNENPLFGSFVSILEDSITGRKKEERA